MTSFPVIRFAKHHDSSFPEQHRNSLPATFYFRPRRQTGRNLTLIFGIETLGSIATDLQQRSRMRGHCEGLAGKRHDSSHLLRSIAATNNRVIAEQSVFSGEYQPGRIALSVL